MGSDSDFIPNCEVKENGLLVCQPKQITRDGTIGSREPMKFHLDKYSGRITVVSTGGASEELVSKTLRHLERNFRR